MGKQLLCIAGFPFCACALHGSVQEQQSWIEDWVDRSETAGAIKSFFRDDMGMAAPKHVQNATTGDGGGNNAASFPDSRCLFQFNAYQNLSQCVEVLNRCHCFAISHPNVFDFIGELSIVVGPL